MNTNTKVLLLFHKKDEEHLVCVDYIFISFDQVSFGSDIVDDSSLFTLKRKWLPSIVEILDKVLFGNRVYINKEVLEELLFQTVIEKKIF